MKYTLITIGALVMCTAMALLIVGCTDQMRARNFGGTVVLKVPTNNIFMNATWKDAELWYLTKDTTDNTFHLRQKKSGWDLTGDGEVIFKTN